jgi:hypothetical protein
MVLNGWQQKIGLPENRLGRDVDWGAVIAALVTVVGGILTTKAWAQVELDGGTELSTGSLPMPLTGDWSSVFVRLVLTLMCLRLLMTRFVCLNGSRLNGWRTVIGI